MSYLTVIAVCYIVAGITSIVGFGLYKLKYIRVTLPVIFIRWDKHGFLELCVGGIYGAVDYLIRLGMLAH